MAQSVFIKQTRQSGAHGYKNNDPCDIVADAADLGALVEQTGSANDPFQIVDVTATPPSNITWALEIERGPEDADGNRPLLRKRLYHMQVNLLPIPLRPLWNQGIRFSLSEAEFTTAVVLKP